MKIKSGVSFNGIQPETIMGMLIAETVLREMGFNFTATSITDGKHRANSLHYAGLAFDVRTWSDMHGNQLHEDVKQELARQLRKALGDEWDVVVEATHIHCEFHPKEAV